MRLVLILSCLLALTAAQQGTVAVFEAYSGSYPPCFREPVLLKTSSDGQSLLALAVGRNKSVDCSGAGDGPPPFLIVLRASSDGGQTWGTRSTLLTSGGIDFLGGVWDGASSAHLFIQDGAKILHSTVAADGSSVSPLVPVTPKLPAGVASAVPAVTVGLRLRGDLCSEPTCAGAVGRFIIPFICHAAAPAAAASRDVACPGCRSCLLLSDDGNSWRFGAVSEQDGSREASAVQVAGAAAGGAALWVTERAMGNETGSRLYALSADGGESFDAFGVDPALPDPVTANWTGVVSGASRFDAGGVARVIFTAPTQRTARADLGVYASVDEARSWVGPAPLWKGPAGYSSTVQVNSTHAAVLFECGDEGSGDFAQRIAFRLMSVADLPAV